jgi:hypothetical protein
MQEPTFVIAIEQRRTRSRVVPTNDNLAWPARRICQELQSIHRLEALPRQPHAGIVLPYPVDDDLDVGEPSDVLLAGLG